jgi:mono/diheme cytochrome c family protein
MRPRPVILAICVLVLAGCGGEKTVAPKPATVVGSVPKQAPTSTTTTTAATTTGGSKSGGGGPSGKAAFASNGCASCHTFKPAGSKATIGPDLDKLPEYAKQANQPLDKFIHESIVNPNAYVQKGFPRGVMPSFASLPKDQLDALVTFLSQGS